MSSIYDPIDEIAKDLKYGEVVIKFEIRQGKVFKVRVVNQNRMWTQHDVDKSDKTEVECK